MKNIIFGMSGIMIVGLIIGLFLYQNQAKTVTQQFGPNTKNQITPEKSGSEQEQPLHADDTTDYALQNNELNITFDQGNSWIKVPIELDKLFSGEYNGNKQELIENSFILTENRVAFLYSSGENWAEQKIIVTYSLDKGKTWKNAVVTESYPSIRFRKVAFLNDNFGYVIISGDRTMSQELSSVFLTNDGGESWEKTTNSGTTRLIADGGFINESTGFLSYGTINPQEPDLYVTEDAGESWVKAEFHRPTKYEQIFVSSEIPVQEGNHLMVLVNQGPNGDYKGGKVKGKFISKDNGKTWDYVMEVVPNEPEQ